MYMSKNSNNLDREYRVRNLVRSELCQWLNGHDALSISPSEGYYATNFWDFHAGFVFGEISFHFRMPMPSTARFPTISE
jgi:hypothetical protein